MKVLLVDDEPDIRKIGKMSLVGVGKFQATLASSAREALDMAAKDRPDLILMDMMMPGMDGLGALEELKNTPELCDIPVIFMTAKVQRNEVDQYISKGAIGVIQKPFDPMTLPAEILRILSLRDKK